MPVEVDIFPAYSTWDIGAFDWFLCKGHDVLDTLVVEEEEVVFIRGFGHPGQLALHHPAELLGQLGLLHGSTGHGTAATSGVLNYSVYT